MKQTDKQIKDKILRAIDENQPELAAGILGSMQANSELIKAIGIPYDERTQRIVAALHLEFKQKARFHKAWLLLRNQALQARRPVV